jgi:hypothetical protein
MPPEESLKPCGAMPSLVGETVDDLSVWAGDVIDWGHVCASRHDALRQWHGAK